MSFTSKPKLVLQDVNLDDEIKHLDVIPVFSRLIVLEKEAERTAGGLYVPETAKEGTMRTTEGIILAVGEEVNSIFKVGATIYYGRYSGAKFSRNGTEYVIMNEEDILGFVRGKE